MPSYRHVLFGSFFLSLTFCLILVIYMGLYFQIIEFYQSRKSQRSIAIILKGSNIPLYGGAASLNSQNGAPIEPVPLTLNFMVRSRAYVLGKLVKTKFYKRVQCSVVMDPKKMSVAISLNNKCVYQ